MAEIALDIRPHPQIVYFRFRVTSALEQFIHRTAVGSG